MSNFCLRIIWASCKVYDTLDALITGVHLNMHSRLKSSKPGAHLESTNEAYINFHLILDEKHSNNVHFCLNFNINSNDDISNNTKNNANNNNQELKLIY